MIINNDDIRGYRIDGNIVCLACTQKVMSENEARQLTQDNLILADEIENAEEQSYFCDRCNEPL